ncbi:MAG: hypothetical protein AB7O04_15935 [Hyphomonadaceae bacterium]
MPWVAVAGGISAVGAGVGAAVNSSAAKKAANTQADASLRAAEIQAEGTRQALGIQQDVYADQRALTAPQTVAGAAAQARQMVLAGIPVEEARKFYTDTVGAIKAGQAVFVPGAAGAATAAVQTAQDKILQDRPDVAAEMAAQIGNRKSPVYGKTLQEAAQYWYDVVRPAAGDPYVLPNAPSSTAPITSAAAPTTTAAPPAPAASTDLSWLDKPYESEDPSYAFRLSEGQKAVERSAAAKGQFFSGALGKGLTRYGQDFASTEFGKSWDRLGQLAGSGTSATGATINAGAGYGDAASSLTTGGANATANGVLGAGNARATGYAAQESPIAAGLSAAGGALSTAALYRGLGGLGRRTTTGAGATSFINPSSVTIPSWDASAWFTP